jgi:hypothetical protein
MPKSSMALPTRPRSWACSAAQAVFEILALDVAQEGDGRERLARRRLHQLVDRDLGADGVHVGAQPAVEPAELAARDLLVQVRHVVADAFVQLRGDHGAEGVRGEVAERAHRPLDVLQAAFHVARGADPEPLLHAGVPGGWQVLDGEIAGKDALLEVVPQHDVQRVRDLVGVDPDVAAAHAGEMPVDVLVLPLGAPDAEMLFQQRLQVPHEGAAAAHHHLDE